MSAETGPPTGRSAATTLRYVSLRSSRNTRGAAIERNRTGRRERSGGAYADQSIANAQALAGALAAAGFDVLGAGRGFTESHHVALDVAGGGTAAAIRLAEGNILTSEIGIPVDPAGGVRIGTQAITRQGFVEADMPAIAEAIAGALLHDRDVRDDVAQIRRRHSGLRFCLTPEDL